MPVYLSFLVLIPLLLAIAWIDLRRGIISNALNLALWMSGLAFLAPAGWRAVAWAIAASVIVAMTFWAISAGYQALRGRAGLGLGDVKFLAAASPWVGLAGLPNLILIACLSGLLTVLALNLLTALRGSDGPVISGATRFAFGPHLALGCGLTVWLGPLQPVGL